MFFYHDVPSVVYKLQAEVRGSISSMEADDMQVP